MGMIEIGHGDLLDEPAEALVNAVNCVGVMGRGLAQQFKEKYPRNFEVYQRVCRRRGLWTGKMLVQPTGNELSPRWIINFPTKRHWKHPSELEYIESGLKDLLWVVGAMEIRSLAIPALGCGLGGLRWRDVRPLIEQAFGDLPGVRAILFEPKGATK